MGLALFAIAALGLQEPTLPATDARLVAVLSRPAKVGMMAELERLAAEGVPGADPMFRGFRLSFRAPPALIGQGLAGFGNRHPDSQPKQRTLPQSAKSTATIVPLILKEQRSFMGWLEKAVFQSRSVRWVTST